MQFIISSAYISYLYPRSTKSRPSTESRRLVKFRDTITKLSKRKKLRNKIRLKEEKNLYVVRYSCHVTPNDHIQVSCCQEHLIALSSQLNQNDLHSSPQNPFFCLVDTSKFLIHKDEELFILPFSIKKIFFHCPCQRITLPILFLLQHYINSQNHATSEIVTNN